MKYNTIKKITAILLVVPAILTGCVTNASTDKSETTDQATENLTIGIAQLVQHPALDASRQGFIDELNTLGVNVEIIDQNAQGDIANAQMIAEKFVKDDVDLIFTIATLTSQAAKTAIKGTDIPMVFTAVTDPVFSELVTAMDVTDENIVQVKENCHEINKESKLVKMYILNDVILAAAEVYYLKEEDFKFQMQNALRHLITAKVMYKKLCE